MKQYIAAFAMVFLPFAANADPMTMVDLLNVPSLDDGRLSPDGKKLLFVKSTANWQKNKNIQSIWLTDVTGQNLKQMTSEMNDDKKPRWSPNGQQFLFLSKRDEDIHQQIYLMRTDGGEAIKLTDHNMAVTTAEWAPNGTEIYFLAKDPLSNEEIERLEEKDDIYKFEENYTHRHLWKISTEDNTLTKITDGDYSISQFKISSDGNEIIIHKAPNPLLDAGLQSEIWIMASNGKKQKQITKNNNPEFGAKLSPNKKRILYISWANEIDEPYYENNLFIVDSDGNNKELLLKNFDHDIEDAYWSDNGNTIYFKANLGVHSELFMLNPDTGEMFQLTNGNHTIQNWKYFPDNNTHIMSIRTANNKGDFWKLHSTENTPQKITDEFDYLAKDFDMPQQESISWQSEDGTTIEGMLIYPNNYNKRKKYPLVVQTHGGPRASDQWGVFSTTSYAPILAAHGYMILRPNYRGSLGYGDAFVRDMVGGYFRNSHLDVMAGVDHLIDLGLVDENKLVKMGYSAGGHMTNKIITYTDRFAAASSAAGTVNWISMYSQSDTRIYRTPWFGGTPWQENAPIDVYWEHSPLKHISRVKTPTMIIVGSADVRVPKEQSIELYRALRENNVPTELYLAPREHHGWKELRHKLSKMNLEMTWFERYIKSTDFKKEKPFEKNSQKTNVILIN